MKVSGMNLISFLDGCKFFLCNFVLHFLKVYFMSSDVLCSHYMVFFFSSGDIKQRKKFPPPSPSGVFMERLRIYNLPFFLLQIYSIKIIMKLPFLPRDYLLRKLEQGHSDILMSSSMQQEVVGFFRLPRGSARPSVYLSVSLEQGSFRLHCRHGGRNEEKVR